MTAALARVGADREIEYPTTEAEIARVRADYAELAAGTPKGYKAVVEAIAVLRGTRTSIEKRRVELKASALEFGRKVDAAAKKLTALVSDIEEPLKAKKQAVDDEEARIKREAERAEMLALEAKLKAEREAEEARLKAAREAEEARLKEQAERQRAEQKRIDDAREALEQQQREVAAQAAEVARREAAARPVPPPAPVAPAAPAPAALRIVTATEVPPVPPKPTPAAPAAVNEAHSYGEAIRALVQRAPWTTTDPKTAEAVAWASERLTFVADRLAEFQPRAGR